MYPRSCRSPWQDGAEGPTVAQGVGAVGIPKEAHLRVLEEGVLVVDAAPTAVEQRVLVPRPGATQPGLLPRLVDAQVRRVDQTALDDVREVSAHVLKGHPGRGKGLSRPVSPPHPAHQPAHSPHMLCTTAYTASVDVASHGPFTSLLASVSCFVKRE